MLLDALSIHKRLSVIEAAELPGVSGSLMPRPSWSGTERSAMVSRAQRVTVVADS
jgi:hypothetical protein